MNKVLFVLPYAGGSSFNFIFFSKFIKNCKIYLLDYPGHGTKIKEKLNNSIEELAQAIVEQILNLLEKDQKFYIFGHSMGGIVAWHVNSILSNKYKKYPEILFISSCSSPQFFSKTNHYDFINKKNLINRLSKNNRMNYKILESEYFQNILLPIIVHDYKLIRNYEIKKIKKTIVPIYTFLGNNDELVKEKDILEWSNLTSSEYKNFIFIGDHFYFEEKKNLFELCSILENIF